MDVLRRQFGIQLRTLRKKAGYTQEQLAEAAGISVDFLSLVERGINAPSFENLEKLSRALHVPVAAFFAFSQLTRIRNVPVSDAEEVACAPVALTPTGFNPHAQLPYGLTTDHVASAMQEFLDFLGFINPQLKSEGIRRLETMLMPANFSSLVGEFIKASIPKYCPTLAENRFHNGHPDLIPRGRFPGDAVQYAPEGIELKASRYAKGWQGHNPEESWLMVFVFDSNRPSDELKVVAPKPFHFLKVVGAQLTKDDWLYSGRAESSRRTITASVTASGFAEMEANWIYRSERGMS